jgi:hypothetical protein
MRTLPPTNPKPATKQQHETYYRYDSECELYLFTTHIRQSPWRLLLNRSYSARTSVRYSVTCILRTQHNKLEWNGGGGAVAASRYFRIKDVDGATQAYEIGRRRRSE